MPNSPSNPRWLDVDHDEPSQVAPQPVAPQVAPVAPAPQPLNQNPFLSPNSPNHPDYDDPEHPWYGIKHKAFVDAIINRLGPDRIFKMTPHQLGTLSAYMYLKMR